MKITFIRHVLKTQTQHQLLAILQRYMELSHLCGVRLETPSSAHTQMQGFYAQHYMSLMQAEETQEVFCNNLPQVYIAGYIKAEQLLKSLTSIVSPIGRAHVIRLLLCSQPGTLSVFKVQDSIELFCPKCKPLPDKLPGIYLGKCKQPVVHLDFSSACLEMIAKDFLFDPDFSYISHHLDLLSFEPKLILRLLREAEGLQKVNVKILGLLVSAMRAVSPEFKEKLGNLVLNAIKVLLGKPLAEQNVLQQRRVLNILNAIAHMEDDEIWLFHWFKMTFFFLVHTRSLVTQEAVLAATEMCASHGLQTINLWNWYKRDALDLTVRLALTGYLSDGVRFTRSLRAVSALQPFNLPSLISPLF